jgi:hypothetical protein
VFLIRDSPREPERERIFSERARKRKDFLRESPKEKGFSPKEPERERIFSERARKRKDFLRKSELLESQIKRKVSRL